MPCRRGALGVQVLEACFRAEGRLSELASSAHPILEAMDQSGPVVVNNCCGVAGSAGEPILLLDRGTRDLGAHRIPVDGVAFGLALEQPRGGGRVVVLGDSGFLADPRTFGPGPGLIDRGGNRDFARSTLRWLLGRP